jgi:hypothetical protein
MAEALVDKDLTMIQPDKSPTDVAYEELVSNAKARSAPISITEPITTKEQATDYVESLQAAQNVSTSMQGGSYDPKLDANKSMFESQNDVRARNQSAGVKGLKAIGGGILQGGLIALEQAGYIADLDTYTNLFTDVDDASGNWWTQLMKDTQENLRETDTFKIYEEEPDANSITSQIFKWSSLEGAVSSALGFGVTGLGAAKLVSHLGSMGKFQELAKFTDIAMGNLKGGAALAEATAAGRGMAGATAAFTGPLASSAMSNFFMGQMMATDTYNQAMTNLAPLIEAGEMTPRQAQELASKEAQDVVGLNMALTATAYIKFGGIFKRQNKIKGLVENPTAMNQLKQLIKTGSPTAFTENVYQEMIQMEQLYDINKEVGLENVEGDNYWDRMTQLALSNRALHAGALGVVGGPIQFALIQRPMMGDQIKHQRNVHGKQKENIKWKDELVKNNFKIFEQFDKNFNEAILKGDVDAAIMSDDFHIINELSKQIEWGTLAILKKDMQDIIKGTPEEAAAKGITDTDYTANATKVLELIESAEGVLRKFGGKANVGEIAHNALLIGRVGKELDTLLSNKIKLQEKLNAAVKNEFKEEVFYNGKGELKFKRDIDRFDGIAPAKETTMRAEEKVQDARLAQILKLNTDAVEFKKITENITKHEKFAEDLVLKHARITHKDYEKEYLTEQEKAKKEAVSTETTEEAKVKTGHKYVPFSTIKEEGSKLSPEEIAEQTKEWDADKGEYKNEILRGLTFSGIDTKGEVRSFTPKELVRSVDGRTFKVEHQNLKWKDAGSTHINMPVLREVGPNGEYKKDASNFILEDIGFLREESRQAHINRDKSTGQGYDAPWGVYPKTDSLLKPSDFFAQSRLVGLAQDGKVVGINISANMFKKGNFDWIKTYNHQLLNLPFKGEYDVTYKLNKVAERETYIDVYKKNADGTELKLTRLNKDTNIAHEDLIALLVANKGEVSGKAIGHYSNAYNLVHHYDEAGNKIYKPVADLSNLSPEYLIDGQLVVAQKAGEGSYLLNNGARGANGKIYEGSTIDILQADGVTFLPKTIPYQGMTAGDTYILIVSPSGDIMPIALSSENLGTMPEQKQVVIDAWVQAIETSLSEEIENHSEDEIKIKKTLIASNNVDSTNPAALQKAYVDVKNDNIYEKAHKRVKGQKSIVYEEFQKTIFNLIRPVTQVSIPLGSEINGKPIFAKTASGEVMIPENYFEPTVQADSTGKYVPAIKVRNPNDFSKLTTYNITDKFAEFNEAIDGKRLRTSLDMLTDSSIQGGPEMDNLINNTGLTTDIDPVNPFVGSSGTFTVDGDDYNHSSSKAANKFSKFLKTKFPKESKFIELTVDSSAQASEEFSERLESILSFEDLWLKHTSASDTTGEVTSRFENLVRSLHLMQEGAALKMVSDVMNSDITQEQEAEYTEILSKLEGGDITKNIEALAKGILVLNKINAEVQLGNMNLRNKQRKTSEEDPTGKFTQPEGIEFKTKARGVLVYHSEYGEAKFDRLVKNGMLQIVNSKGQNKVVFPGDVFLSDGDRAELSRTNKKLSKLNKDTEEFKSLTDKKVKLITKIQKSIDKATKVNSKENDTTFEDDVENTKDPILQDLFETIGTNDSARNAMKLFTDTARTRDIAKTLENLTTAIDNLSSMDNGPVTAEASKSTHDLLAISIPYTATQLEGLVGLVEDKIANSVDVAENTKNRVVFNNVKKLLNSLESRTNFEASEVVPTTRYSIKNSSERSSPVTLPGSQMGKEGKLALEAVQDIKGVFRIIQDAVIAESQLKGDLFTKVSAPKKIVDDTKKVKEDTDEITELFGEQETINFKREPLPTTAIPNKALTPTEVLTVKYKAPTEVTNLIEQANISKAKVAELLLELRTADAEEMDLNEVFETFVKKNTPEFMEFDNDVSFKRGDDVSNTKEAFDAEVASAQALLPQLTFETVESVTKMVNRFGTKAIGAYHKGVAYLVQNAKEGTAYHEAFHAVSELFLTQEEKLAMAIEQKHKKWNPALEEMLADEFAEYMKTKNTSLGARVKRFFNSILNYFRGTRSADVTEGIFNKIATKGYAKSKSLNWTSGISPLFNSIAEYKKGLSKNNSVLLQSLLDSNKIEIVC